MGGQNGTIRGTGIDIVSVPRMRRAVDRFGDRLVMKILGPQELALYRERHNRMEYLAGRFAAKEAIIKALAGLLAVRPAFTHLQIVNDAQGQPVFCPAEALARSLTGVTVLVSIAHERTHAVATALIQVRQ